MMTPCCWLRIILLAASRPHRKTPVRLTSMTCCHCCSDRRSTISPSLTLTSMPSRKIPALFTRPVIGPKRCSIAAKPRSTLVSEATSQVTAILLAAPACSQLASTSSSRSPLTSSRASFAPCRASEIAIASPSPCAAPVMTKLLSLMFNRVVLWFVDRFLQAKPVLSPLQVGQPCRRLKPRQIA